MSSYIDEYNKERDFDATLEPSGAIKKTTPKKRRRIMLCGAASRSMKLAGDTTISPLKSKTR